MAHRNNLSRTLRTSHHLQDDRLFSLSGGISMILILSVREEEED